MNKEFYINQPKGFELHGMKPRMQIEEGPLIAEASTTCLVLND